MTTDAPSDPQRSAPGDDAAGAPQTARRATRLELMIVAVLGAALVSWFALHQFSANDYKSEFAAPLEYLRHGHLSDFLSHLPGYPGAAISEGVVALPAILLGAGTVTLWRFLSLASVALLLLALYLVAKLLERVELPRWAALLAMLLAAGSPALSWTLRIGHPEDVFATALLVIAVLSAARGRWVLTAVLIGLAAGKLWPVVVALPVLALLLPDLRRALKAAALSAAITVLWLLPAQLSSGSSVHTLATTGAAQLFDTNQIWWFFGERVHFSGAGLEGIARLRVGPAWTGTISHPLIALCGLVLGAAWAWLRMRGTGITWSAALRTPSSETLRPTAAGANAAISSALLLMAGVLWLRCTLDTWNVAYYTMPALIFGAFGEALRGRWPYLTLIATGLMWKLHPPNTGPLTQHPDLGTAIFLLWALPLAIGFIVWGLRTAGTPAGQPAHSASPAA